MRARVLVPFLLLALLGQLPAGAADSVDHDGVTAVIGANDVTLSNGVVTRVWSRNTLETQSVGRIGATFDVPQPDFVLSIDYVGFASSFFLVQDVDVSEVPGGAAVTWKLGGPDGLQIVRRVEAYGGIAGFKSQTTIASTVPLVLSGYTLDEVAVGSASQSIIQSFRAGADWRDPNFKPPSIGDPHDGDFRESRPNGKTGDTPQYGNSALQGQGEWLSVNAGGRNAGIVAERRDYASSVMTYTGGANGVARAEVDLSRDVVYIGPFEEDGHVENPGPGPARHRVFGPDPVKLEPAFTVFGADEDDEAWQFHKYLTQHRKGDYKKRVMFNSDKVDDNVISTGAKDDMNYERFLAILPAVKEMGADTFIFDDGWMARSGDWCPDSPECPEPRWDGQPGSKFRPRFLDSTFSAVREQLGDIELGLWMNPMEFNPSAKAFQMNPQWACIPVGDALAAYNVVEPNSSSNEAGLGVWNPLALGVHPDTGEPILMIDYMKGRIQRAINVYGARYFKFDFLAWVDCGGAFPVTMYEYHDAFVNMLDEIRAELPPGHPEVTFSIDETNDYRMFPFESTSRGPAWFLNNGGSNNSEILHAVWNLSPYIPGYSLGMRNLGGAATTMSLRAIDTAMASSLLGHMTFSFPADERLTPTQRAQVKTWTDFYHANSETIAGMTYPLLDKVNNDPTKNGWTALQPWNGDTQNGWLLAYRQASTASSHLIALRGLGLVPDDTQFSIQLLDPAGVDGAPVTYTALQLRSGFNVQIAQPGGYAIYRITKI